MYRTLSEILTLCKQNLGLRDLPKPVTDEELKWRLEHSALKDYSIVYPYRTNHIIGEKDRICRPYPGIPTNVASTQHTTYQIPRHYYQNRTIISVSNVIPARSDGYNDLFVPAGVQFGNAANIISSMASLQMVAAMGRVVSHSLTWDLKQPDILVIYNGWQEGYYEIELLTTHDPSLSTIEPGTMLAFRRICELDLKEYLYKKLSRVQGLELGVGNIELKIDDWADAGAQKEDLLKELSDDSELDNSHIQYW